MASFLIFSERRRAIPSEEHEIRDRKCSLENSETPASNPPGAHFNIYVSAYRKFVGVTVISYLSESDIWTLHLEAKDWEIAYRAPRKPAVEIPA